MRISYVKGDLMKTPYKGIVHGCNAQGVMGSGVAKAIRDNFPQAYHAYVEEHKLNGLTLGHVIPVKVKSGQWIFNAITQEFYGRDNTRYVSYIAVRLAMRWIDNYVALHNCLHPEDQLYEIAMPRIGAGLGGGDWNEISRLIEEEAKVFKPIVYYINDSDLPDDLRRILGR